MKMKTIVIKVDVPEDMTEREYYEKVTEAQDFLNNKYKTRRFRFGFFEASLNNEDKESLKNMLHPEDPDEDYETQVKKILRILESGGSVTSMESFGKFKITRLSAAIYTIRRKLLIPVEGVFEVNPDSGKRYKRYFICRDALKCRGVLTENKKLHNRK